MQVPQLGVSLNTIQCAQSHASSFLTFAEVLVLLMTQIVIVYVINKSNVDYHGNAHDTDCDIFM